MKTQVKTEAKSCAKCHQFYEEVYEFSKNGVVLGWVQQPEILKLSTLKFTRILCCGCKTETEDHNGKFS